MGDLFEGVYRGRRVFLTGHTGFKGAWLARWLLDLGAEVAGYALAPNTKPNAFGVLRLGKDLRHILGDVRDGAALKKSLRAYRPHIIFHMAAQSLVRASYGDPVGTYATNVMGTVSLLEAARKLPGLRAVVNVTSDKCYENREWVYGYRETDSFGGFDPYSSSKGCAEIVTSAYRRSFFSRGGPALASARAGNVIGGGDWSVDRLVPDCIRALTRGRPVRLRNPQAIRPWQHVLEPLAGYLLLGARLLCQRAAFAEGWNFGPADGNVVTVGEIARRIVALWGRGSVRAAKGAHPHEAQLLRLDAAKARHRLGWKPVFDIPETLDLTVKWYKAQAEGETDMVRLTREQIRRYTEKASVGGIGHGE